MSEPKTSGLGAPGDAESLSPAYSATQLSGPASAISPLAPSSLTPAAATADSLERRVKQLEKELQSALGRQQSPSTTLSSPLRKGHQPFVVPQESPESRDIDKTFVSLPIRGTISKTRFFGQSHWASGANMIPSKYKLLLHLMDRAQQEKTSKIYGCFQKCKALGRVIKAHRVPHLPALSIGQSIPPRPVADRLIDGYLRTFETIYRVLHVPSFRVEYERYWEQPDSAGQAFVVLMQLCMAIGACFHDDTHSFRAQATGWVYEARFWLLLPPEKARLTITGLQIMCLLQLAKQTAGVSGDLTWISAGTVIRAAMAMGLNHDPDNLVRMAPLRAEMRRRLWATILELDLQSSLDAGAPALISARDFDTRPLANADDHSLSKEANNRDPPPVRGHDAYTQTSAQVTLFESFTTRLAIVNHVNDPQSRSPDYHETLRLSADLVAATRSLMRHLRSFSGDEHGVEGPSPFQLRFLEMIMNRYLLALHLPWWNEALRSPTHYFSRKMSVDAARTLATIHRTGGEPGQSVTDFARLLVCGSGPFRSTPVHACLTLTLEYMYLKEEERDNQGLTMATSDSLGLRPAFDWQTEWWVQRIRAGETNIKSYAFGQVLDSLLEALNSNLDEQETMALIMDQATTRVEECYEMLKALAGGVDAEVVSEGAAEDPWPGSDIDLMDFSFLDRMELDDGMVGYNTFDLFFKEAGIK